MYEIVENTLIHILALMIWLRYEYLNIDNTQRMRHCYVQLSNLFHVLHSTQTSLAQVYSPSQLIFIFVNFYSFSPKSYSHSFFLIWDKCVLDNTFICILIIMLKIQNLINAIIFCILNSIFRYTTFISYY